ncbi:NAD-dependent epimerase/dehydratase family protein [Pseudenhygromyxa sp. WMMC2535]|uniref:NAD-dependent epimerase/dehydratase family protein n=1 Tax=Pseudenhygromyxa sp. WMMC2535 TaxID=2712867 RepID=UPI001555FC35|nr:NAD-dependent epimerase/dehydratase family protein [Pseudenhygromyxa sp. WMMC2535]NVB37521.1 NAD-dependent epimerase/dehydratase family protein [Pseudenhygromyxa sp. WMMC2535]
MANAPSYLPPRGKTLVTGGSGHFGANLVRRLIAEGHEVRALYQPEANNRGLDGLDIERFAGDLRDRARILEAVTGCGQVFHAGAKVSTRSPSAQEEREIWEINVLGTRNMVRASLETGVDRFCLTGSFSGIGIDPEDPSRPVHEGMPFYPFMDWLPYARSKTLAEHELLKGVADGLDAVIAVSTGIIGPNDFLPSRTGKTLVDFAAGRLRGYIPGGSEFVRAADLVEGHLLAMAKGKTGRRYLLSTEFLSLDQLLELFIEQAGGRKPRLRMPVPLMKGVAQLYASTVRRVAPNAPQRLTPGAIEILAMNRHADISLAREELGYEPTSMREAVRETYAFFCEVGMIQRRAA